MDTEWFCKVERLAVEGTDRYSFRPKYSESTVCRGRVVSVDCLQNKEKTNSRVGLRQYIETHWNLLNILERSRLKEMGILIP